MQSQRVLLFSAMTMAALGRAAIKMVEEVRRQLREIPAIMEGTNPPDGACAVRIATDGALRKMVLPGALAVVVPGRRGCRAGGGALGGLLIGSIGTGAALAPMMADAGGACDNAKKVHRTGAPWRKALRSSPRGRRW